MFKQEFSNFTCFGDTAVLERGGITYRATVEPDCDTCPDDYQCYSDDVVKSWSDDGWYFCYLRVTVEFSVCIFELPGTSGVELNLGDDRYLNDVFSKIVDENHESVIKTLRSCSQFINDQLRQY